MKILLTLIFIISTLNLLAQEKSEFKGWKFGINISPELGYRFLYTNSTDSMMDYIINQRNDWEIPALMISSGLSTEYRFSKLISIKSGIYYSLRGEKSRDHGYGSEYNGFGTYIEKWIYKNRYHYIGVPIIGAFHFLNKEKFQLFTSIGVSFDFLYLRTSRSAYKIHGEEEVKNFEKEKINNDTYYDYNLFNPSGLISIGLDWKLGNKSTIRIEPNFKISILPLLNAPILSNYYNCGLNLGYIYSFN